MTRTRFTLAALVAAPVLTACASGSLGDVFSQGTAEDAIGLPRAEPGAVVIDDGDTTVATPYGGAGEDLTCGAAARDIARLTAVLGPDAQPPREEPAADADDDDVTEFASDIVEGAPDAAGDAARSAIVGLNPARPIVRFLGQASEIEAAAQRERELALKRRAWLRGAFDALECDHAVLTGALGAYNLLAEPEAG
ncbi:MAG: hypothetical protein NXI12_14710 [Alphaproteobacteria bacterium]|nr:hypothetical protein [Alphaproteobacteria bacterium]